MMSASTCCQTPNARRRSPAEPAVEVLFEHHAAHHLFDRYAPFGRYIIEQHPFEVLVLFRSDVRPNIAGGATARTADDAGQNSLKALTIS